MCGCGECVMGGGSEWVVSGCGGEVGDMIERSVLGK